MSHALGTTIKTLFKLGRTPDDCWTWLGTVNNEGYGHKTVGKRVIPIRRWMWMTLFGCVPEGLVVTNTCGLPNCCNPHHLRCVFQAQASRAGANCVLLPADVAEIREAGRKVRTAADRRWGSVQELAKRLGDKHGVDPTTIFDVWAGKSWKRPRRTKRAKITSLAA